MNKARGVCLILLVGLFAYANPTPSPPSDATATKRGLVNTTSQTFSGLKTFVDGGIIADLRPGTTVSGVPIVPLQTTSALTYFVDLAGNDTASCLDAGVAACRTLQGVFNKLPRFVNHDVLINVAAGNFDSGDAGTTLDSIEINSSASITIQGSQSYNNFIPDGGSSSGTLTSYTAFTNVPMVRTQATDSSQSWPVATLGTGASAFPMRGQFVCWTSGAAAGTKSVISSTGSTTLFLARNPSPAPTAGTTYQLCTPSTVLSMSSTLVGSQATLRIGMGSGRINLNDLTIVGPPTTTTTAFAVRGWSGIGLDQVGSKAGDFAVSATRLRIVSGIGVSGTAASVVGGYSVTFTNSALIAPTQTEGGNASISLNLGNVSAPQGEPRATLSGVYMRTQRVAIQSSQASIALNGVSMDSDNVTPQTVISMVGGFISSVTQSYIDCYSFGNIGVANNLTGISISGGASLRSVGTLKISNCLIALSAGAGHSQAFTTSTAGTPSFEISNPDLLSKGVVLAPGSSAIIAPVVTTVFAVADGGYDYVCPDGVTTYTNAQVIAAPGRFVNCGGVTLTR